MTMSEELAIDEQAKNFVNKFVTPILGHIASVKVHKLLCHVADPIRWHGNIQKCNTGVNESEHKSDKPFYARTSENAHTFTRQIVRHAHGSRAILARHAKADEVAATTWHAELSRRAAVQSAAVAGGAAGPLHSGAAAVPGGLATAPSGAPADGRAAVVRRTADEERRRKQKRWMYNASKVSVGYLASRPDLANVGALLKMAAHRQVRVPTRTPIQTQFECGTRVQQQLRAVEDFLGAPWYDAVLYRPGGDQSKLCIGELRAIIRGPKGDAVILAAMEDVAAEPLCTFVARGCVRLKWVATENASGVKLRLVPVAHVQRLAFVVPDFADLAARRGVGAEVPAMDSALQERLDMRFFLNVFFPGEVK